MNTTMGIDGLLSRASSTSSEYFALPTRPSSDSSSGYFSLGNFILYDDSTASPEDSTSAQKNRSRKNSIEENDFCCNWLPDKLYAHSVTWREALQAGCCCIVPNITTGERIRDCLCCSTWSNVSVAGVTTGATFLVNTMAMKTLFLPALACATTTNLLCYCRLIKC